MGAATMEVNAQDHDDVVLIQDSEIVESHAEGVVASKTNNNNNNNSSPNIASAHADLRQLHVDSKDTNSNSSSEETQRTSDGLMVAAVLLASMIFQIASNPPGGVWQEDNFLMDSQGHYVDPLGRRVSTPVDSHNNSVPYPRQAGHSVLARNDPVLYMIVCVCNGVGFSTSLAVILILMGGVPSNKLLLLAFYVISFFAFSAVSATYSYGVVAVTPKDIGLEIHQFALKLPFFCFVSLSAFFFVYGYWSSVKGNLKWLLVRMRTAVELVRNRVQALGRLEEVVEDVPQTKIETGIGTGIRMILRTSVASSAVV